MLFHIVFDILTFETITHKRSSILEVYDKI